MKKGVVRIGLIVTLIVCCLFCAYKMFGIVEATNGDDGIALEEGTVYASEEETAYGEEPSEDASVIYENNSLNLMGNDSEDSMVVRKTNENGKAEIAVSISTRSGQSKTILYDLASDKDLVSIATGRLNRQDRDSVVIEITNGTSNYASSSIYVIHAEQDGEELFLSEDLTILDRDSQDEAVEKGIYSESLLKMPAEFTITMTMENELIAYVDRIERYAIKLNEYDSGTKDNIEHYIYWTEGGWKISEGN